MVNYWCIDDESSTATSEIALLNASADDIQISLREPTTLKDLLADIASKAPDGLILDLRLDEVPSKSKYIADYRAGTLAQQIRSLAAEKRIPEFPIVLWSSEPNLRKSYDNDIMSHGLFDRVYIKNRVVDDPKRVAFELKHYAAGYKALTDVLTSGESSLVAIVGAQGASADFINSIVLSSIQWNQICSSTHTLARWILRRLVRSPGPLLDEQVLAARLGVSANDSADWSELAHRILSDCMYRGPFCEIALRWWALNIEEWWTKLQPDIPLSLTPPEERVQIIKKASKLEKLSPVQVGEGKGPLLWYVCERTLVALDPKDGLAMVDEDLESWNEPQFVSIEYALTDSKVPLQPIEKQRLQAIKAARSKK